MTEDQATPDQQHPERSTRKPLWRRGLILLTVTLCTAGIAAWWCFGPRPLPTLPATVATGQVAGDIWSVASKQSDAPTFFVRRETDDWNRAFVVMDEQGTVLDLSLPTPAVDDQHSMTPGLGALLTDKNGRSVYCGPNGTVVVKEPDGSMQHVLLKTPPGVASIGTSSTSPFGHDVAWRNDRLSVFFGGNDEAGNPRSWLAHYDLQPNPEPQRFVPPSSFEELDSDGFRTRLSGDGKHWVTLNNENFGRNGKPSRLIVSTGESITLPVIKASMNGKPSTGSYITFLGTPESNRFHVFRSSADESRIELIDAIRPGADLEPRPPLALPTHWINHHVSKISPDGRYALLSRKDYRRPNLGKRYPLLRKFESHRIIEDLVLIDLVEWNVAAYYEVTTSQVGTYPKPFLLRPEFDSTGRKIIVPHQQGRFSVIDVEQWISQSNDGTAPVAQDDN